MHFCIILGLLSISVINAKYLLVDIDDDVTHINQGTQHKPITGPGSGECVTAGGRCFEKNKHCCTDSSCIVDTCVKIDDDIIHINHGAQHKPITGQGSGKCAATGEKCQEGTERPCCSPFDGCAIGICLNNPVARMRSANKSSFRNKKAQSRSLNKPKVQDLEDKSEERSLEDKMVSGENSTESMEFGINEAESLENKTESMENEKMISLESETESVEKNMKVNFENMTESMEEGKMISMENSTDSMEEKNSSDIDDESLERKHSPTTEDVNCHWKDLKGKCIDTCFGGFLETGSLKGGLVCHCTGKQCDEDPCKDCEAKAKAKGQKQWTCPC